MTTKRTKPSKSTTSLTESASSFGDPAVFPFGRYTSVVGVHTSLLLFTTLVLPGFFDVQVQVQARTSKDRPQHPFLDAITMNPAITTAVISGGAVVLQSWWGGFVRKWWVDYSMRADGKVERFKLWQFVKAWGFTFAASIPIHVFLVLLGAPVSTHIMETYFLALFLSILTLFTPAFVFGLPSLSSKTEALLIRLTWVRLFSEFSIRTPVERAIVYPVLGTVIGCWLGAIPIALDWDRPWQAWPLTSLFGSVLGYILSSIAALTISATKSLADDRIRTLRTE